MATHTERTLDDRLSGVARFIRALDRDPSEWDPEQLAGLAHLEYLIREVRFNVIYGMREHGVTDGQIAEALGITQQAVSKRWPGGGKFQGAAGRYRTSTPTTGGSN